MAILAATPQKYSRLLSLRSWKLLGNCFKTNLPGDLNSVVQIDYRAAPRTTKLSPTPHGYGNGLLRIRTTNGLDLSASTETESGNLKYGCQWMFVGYGHHHFLPRSAVWKYR